MDCVSVIYNCRVGVCKLDHVLDGYLEYWRFMFASNNKLLLVIIDAKRPGPSYFLERLPKNIPLITTWLF